MAQQLEEHTPFLEDLSSVLSTSSGSSQPLITLVQGGANASGPQGHLHIDGRTHKHTHTNAHIIKNKYRFPSFSFFLFL